ncbi:hypothetical protein F0562_035273 [Nyssa sinensis]|uniref:Uncharacterized protein n=1 Tax=Nyssa sinensis TaxID=561372 RepID=A0A5J5ACL3_9ASTE|nr:hypothetical protein F0562_035273 [Nyssa sinensis]
METMEKGGFPWLIVVADDGESVQSKVAVEKSSSQDIDLEMPVKILTNVKEMHSKIIIFRLAMKHQWLRAAVEAVNDMDLVL